jgi:hypothetical protein
MLFLLKVLSFFLLISFSGFGQAGFLITGKVELQGTDIVSPTSMGLLTKIKSTDSVQTKIFQIADNGWFNIDSLQAGLYRLTFRVHEEYNIIDTVLKIEADHLYHIKIEPDKMPCHYDADSDIRRNEVSILIANMSALRTNSESDDKFEKKFNLRYLILSSPFRNWACLKRYNGSIFTYLDGKYGDQWRKLVRNDAIGLK